MISKIVFFGDSITAANRNEQNLMGDGYVSILRDKFFSHSHMKHIQFVNSGVNGHMVGDLLDRYKVDVIPHQPDAVVINIGINDAYNDYSSGLESKTVHKYASGLKQLILNLRSDLPMARLFLFTPYLISDSRIDSFYLRMIEYCDAVKSAGSLHDIPVLDVQSVFDIAVETKPAVEWAHDQIHPHYEGHALIARAAFSFLSEHIVKT